MLRKRCFFLFAIRESLIESSPSLIYIFYNYFLLNERTYLCETRLSYSAKIVLFHMFSSTIGQFLEDGPNNWYLCFVLNLLISKERGARSLLDKTAFNKQQ